jgi:hypothetical protein
MTMTYCASSPGLTGGKRRRGYRHVADGLTPDRLQPSELARIPEALYR